MLVTPENNAAYFLGRSRQDNGRGPRAVNRVGIAVVGTLGAGPAQEATLPDDRLQLAKHGLSLHQPGTLRRMFVTFEGVDGAGKSTLIEALAGRLRAEGHSVLVTHEPGEGTFGQAVRQLLLGGPHIGPEAELFLFLADRSEHVRTMIRPALGRGDLVLCDRYIDSTVVYQGYGRGMGIRELRDLNHRASGGLVPDRTFILDLSQDEASRRSKKGDRLDREEAAFHQRVREGFLAEAAIEPSRFVVLDASCSRETLAERAWQALPW